ncbi:MAG: NYN domain-containing protein [Candidatus Aminicenantes bacterium]|nr:MAG: NYN domain-containing protein [Candidatus Aminicenantes bacterium]
MPYIIDGDNLIGSFPDIFPEDPKARAKLVYIIRKFQENKKNNVIIVFDGVPESRLQREDISTKFCVRYPPEGDSADDEIKRLLNGLDYFRDVTVVTSDRELKTFARKKGAKTVNSTEFYFELKRISRIYWKKEETKKRIDTELSDTEVDQWMKIFER